LDELIEHYIARERDPTGGRQYPTPYPEVSRWGFRWIKVHRYWFSYVVGRDRLLMTNVLHDTANIPRRVAAEDDEAPFQP
jgi:hypothetical protein